MKEELKCLLSQRERKICENRSLAPAAVIVPLYEKEGEWYLLFTKRTEKVREHKGQISFPGGARHQDDESLEVTALRECCEEIGLKGEDVEIVGQLDEVPTVASHYLILPFVAFIPYPYRFNPNPEEVEELLEVPLRVLLDRANFREEMQFHQGEFMPVYFYDCNGRVVWGATARVLKQFLELLSERIGQIASSG